MTSKRRRGWIAVACAALVALGALMLFAIEGSEHGPETSNLHATVSAIQALGADDASGYARAEAPRPLDFPRDHGPHPEFRTEWWYYTGNLQTATGRHFGFQLTFFRYALRAAPLARASSWATTQAYLAHFAVTDVHGRRFFASGRSSREALGLAGAQGVPFRVWLDDWSADGDPSTRTRLHAADGPVAIDLALEAVKPVVLQGDRGLSRKGPEPGNASYYYSLPRSRVTGTLTIAEERLAVEGLAWMDREWGTSALGKELAGWDWFALQLDDARDLMFYQLRRKDGSRDPFSAGALVDRRGVAQRLARDDVRIDTLSTWRSPRSGITYPARWRFTDVARALVLEITPRLPQQELLVGQRYWEGAVEIRGTDHGQPVAGQGYVELVGYGEDDTAVRRSID